jgi:cobalt-precorrin-5B (C1)-methyltransferase
MDLHSSRSRLDHDALAGFAAAHGAPPPLAEAIAGANTASQILGLAEEAGLPLADLIAAEARRVGQEAAGADIALEVIVVDRQGRIAGRAAGW